MGSIQKLVAVDLLFIPANGGILLLHRSLDLCLLSRGAGLRNTGQSIPGVRFIFNWIFPFIRFREGLRGERFSRCA
jgi:hypothetical protein